MQEINVVHEKRTKMKLEQTDISKTKSETNATIRRQQATVPANKRNKAPEEWRLSAALGAAVTSPSRAHQISNHLQQSFLSMIQVAL
jgi:hypothetical protein